MQHETNEPLTTNELGFLNHADLDWPTPDGQYVVRLLSKISDSLTQCHPGNPSLYHELVPELNRLSKRLPRDQIQRDTYEFLQRVTQQAIELAAHWQSFVPYLEPLPRVGPPRKPRKQRSAVIDAMSRRIDREAREAITDALAG